jgi:phospholipid transport system substrate-binding protein
MRGFAVWSSLALVLPSSLLLTLLAAAPAATQPVQQEIRELVDAVVAEVLVDISANKASYEADEAALRAMVNSRIAPHFNFARITQLAMGKNASGATAAQRSQLVEAFQNLLVRSYATSLLDVPTDDPTSNYRYISQQAMGANGAIVQIEVRREQADPVMLNLRMDNRGGKWQVIDVVIDGVSMVVTYRSQFEQKINTDGIDGLITALQSEW